MENREGKRASFFLFLGVSGVQANTGKSKTGRNVEYRLAREERQSTKAQGPLSLFKKKNADANK